MLHNEDRELQIRLAELQADIQISLVSCFGLLAFLITIMIGYFQVLLSPSPEAISARGFATVSMIALAFLLIWSTTHFFKEALRARKQMAELRKQFVW